jgi:hypothetical protein
MLTLRHSRSWLPLCLSLGLLLLFLAGCSDDDDNGGTNPGLPATGDVPAELVGQWSAAAAFVNGAAVDPGDVLEWIDVVDGNLLTVNQDGTYVEQEFADDRSVVDEYHGVIFMDGNQIVVLEDSAGKAAADTAFAGTWALGNNVLVLTQVEDGDTVTLHFHRLITVDIAFQVTYLDDDNNLLGGAVVEGMTGTGFYTYDAGVEDTNALATVGDYWSTIAPCGIFLTLGSLHFQTDLHDVDFLLEIGNNQYDSDFYLLRSYNNLALSDTLEVDHIAWQLDDDTGTALDSTDMPLTAPNLADWVQGFALSIEGNMVDDSYNDFIIRCTVTSATLAE